MGHVLMLLHRFDVLICMKKPGNEAKVQRYKLSCSARLIIKNMMLKRCFLLRKNSNVSIGGGGGGKKKGGNFNVK